MKKYYIAEVYNCEAFMPVIMQAFYSKENALQFLKLVNETTTRKVVLLEAIEDISKDPEEQRKPETQSKTWFGKLIDNLFS